MACTINLYDKNRCLGDEHPTKMRLISLNTGVPREVEWHGHTVTTGIFKEPVEGRIALRKLNLDGDRQADLTVHGGEHKAVYSYPLEHYAYWKNELHRDLPLAMFGENFTTEGMLETSVHIGDRFSIGSGEVIVTQPRQPCFKLGIRFESDMMVKRFLASGRSGFYLAVTREGEVGAGDEFQLVSPDPRAISVADFSRLYAAKKYTKADIALLDRLMEITSVPEDWKTWFQERVASH